MLACKDCCYYSASEVNEHEHCCFNEWGHGDDEVAPCDYDEPDEYRSNAPCDNAGFCVGTSCPQYFSCQQ